MTGLTQFEESATAPTAQARLTERWKMLAAVSLAIAPTAIFYTILFRLQTGLPFWDDYDGLLGFVNGIEVRRSGLEKIFYFLAAQHNEYKLYFENALAWLDVRTTRHISFGLLCAIGNSFVLLIGMLLWKMFLPGYRDVARRVILFVPVSCLLFQLQYAETLNWAMAATQNIPVIAFSLMTIYLLMQRTRRAYLCALAGLALAVASSGNGLLMVPIGAQILIVRRRYARVAGWIAVSALCVAAYAYRYRVNEGGGPVRPAGLIARLFYLFSFIGNVAAPPFTKQCTWIDLLICVLFGVILCIFFAAMARRGYFRRRPLIGYCVLFLLLTALGVSGIRSGFGVAQSFSSRYGIYPALLLIFAWFAIAEEFVAPRGRILRKGILAGAIVASTVFTIRMDVAGFRFLEGRNKEVMLGLKAYERTASSPTPIGPLYPLEGKAEDVKEFELIARAELKEAMRLGIYRLPSL